MKNILITGGTGFLGKLCAYDLAEQDGTKRIVIFSRRWDAQEQMEAELPERFKHKFRFINGDIRDEKSLDSAMKGIDTIIHSAAYKHIVKAEYNPREVKTVNVDGSQNVIDLAIKNNVERVLAISTDKAASPYNAYGKTKALMESAMVSANNLGDTIFNVARFGNMWGSTGSVTVKWEQQIKKGKLNLRITDPEMTRFFIFRDGLSRYIQTCLSQEDRGLVLVPVMESVKIGVLADIFNKIAKNYGATVVSEIVGAREGEKSDEVLLVSKHEESFTRYLDEHTVAVFPSIAQWGDSGMRKYQERKIDLKDFSSDTAKEISLERLEQQIFDDLESM